MDSEKLQAVKDKIEKLLRLSKSPELHEAEVAAAQAQALMTEYQISQASLLGDETQDEITMSYDLEDFQSPEVGKRIPIWKNILWTALGTANGCQAFTAWVSEGSKALHLIGTRDAVQSVSYLYRLISRQINCMGDHYACVGYGAEVLKLKTSYCRGATERVVQRLAEAAAQARAKACEGQTDQALVVIDQAIARLDAQRRQVDEKAAEVGLTPRRTSNNINDQQAWNAGYEDGNRVTLGGDASQAIQGSKVRLEASE